MALTGLVLVVLLSGCSRGEQQGRHAVSTVRTFFFDNPNGFMIVFYGNDLNADFEPVGQEGGLLYIIVLGDNKYTSGYDNSAIENSRKTSTFSLRSDQDTFSVTWNRENGRVTMMDESFDRANGNVIVLPHRDANAGTIQFSMSLDHTDVRTAIEAIARHHASLADLANWAAEAPK